MKPSSAISADGGPPAGAHVSQQALAYVEGRLSLAARAAVEAHLAGCPACRAEVDDLRHLADVLGAAPRALDSALAARRARLWAGVWAQVAQPIAPHATHARHAWALAVAMCVLVVTGLLASPFQRGAFAAASEPQLVVIQTPAAPHSSLTSLPAGAEANQALDSTATLVLQQGQTPAPVPNP